MLAVLPHLVLVVGMSSVLFLAWRADHPRIEGEPKPLRSPPQRQSAPHIAGRRLAIPMWSVGKALQTRALSAEPAQRDALRLLQR